MLCFSPSVCFTPHMVWFASKNGIAYWCEDPRPHAWSMCASCLCSCIFQSRATPPGRSRYQTSEFSTSEFPAEIPTHNRTQAVYFSNGEGGMVDIDTGKRWGRHASPPPRAPPHHFRRSRHPHAHLFFHDPPGVFTNGIVKTLMEFTNGTSSSGGSTRTGSGSHGAGRPWCWRRCARYKSVFHDAVTTRWSPAFSSEVNLPHVINSRAFANLVT